jgi:hypothetical protein
MYNFRIRTGMCKKSIELFFKVKLHIQCNYKVNYIKTKLIIQCNYKVNYIKTKLINGVCILFLAKSNSTPKLGGKYCKENKEWTVEKVTYLGNFFNAE